MRRSSLLAVPAAALLLLSVTPVPAQTPSSQPAPPLMTAPRPDDQRATEPAASSPGVAGEAPSEEMRKPAPPAGGTSSPPVAALPPGALTAAQAKEMVGKPVADRDGRTVGKISNFVLDPQSGAPDRVVLWMDGRSGEVSAPVAALRTDSATPVLDLDPAGLQPAPAANGSQLLMPRQ